MLEDSLLNSQCKQKSLEQHKFHLQKLLQWRLQYLPTLPISSYCYIFQETITILIETIFFFCINKV